MRSYIKVLCLVLLFQIQLSAQVFLDAGFSSDFDNTKDVFFDVADIPGYDSWYPKYYAGEYGSYRGVLGYWEKKDFSTPDTRFGFIETIPNNPDMNPADWNEPDYSSGKWINARVIKFNKFGRVLVNGNKFSLSDNIYITVRYRDDLANQVVKNPEASWDPDGTPVYVHSGTSGNGEYNYNKIGIIGGAFDHKWKTQKYMASAGQWGYVEKNGQKYIAIKFGNLDYQRSMVGILAIDKIVVANTQNGDNGLVEQEEKAGYWPHTAAPTKFDNLYQDRVFELNGKPQFIYGTYFRERDITPEDGGNDLVWADAATAKMNVIIDYRWNPGYETIGQMLDKAQNYGMKLVLWEFQKLWSSGYALPQSFESSREFTDVVIKGMVEPYKNHPALFGWYGIDEFSNDGDTKNHVFIREYYDRIKAADPNHPTLVVSQAYHMDPEWEIIDRVIGDVNDIVAIDVYLNSNKFDVATKLVLQGLYMKNFRDFNNKYTENKKVLLLVPQGPQYEMDPPYFNYGNYTPCGNSANIICGQLIITQAYNAITQGGKGVLYFTRELNRNKELSAYKNSAYKEDYNEVWENGFIPLGSELFGNNGIADIVVAPGKEVYGSVESTAMSIDSWGLDFYYVNYMYKEVSSGPKAGKYLIAVNLDDDDRSVDFSVPGLTSGTTIYRLFDGGTISSSGDKFSDSIEAFGRRVYKIGSDVPAGGLQAPQNIRITR